MLTTRQQAATIVEKLISVAEPHIKDAGGVIRDAKSAVDWLRLPGVHYQIWGPDGIPVYPQLFPTADQAVRQASMFVARYQRQGYYRDSNCQELSLMELAQRLRVEEYPALMTAEKAYVHYIEDNLDRMDEGWRPVGFPEFIESEECANYMDPDRQEDEE